jgi:NAD(P)-dependent dehydrogenase (short-subunit alcohol dehydrogenase family)
MPGRIVLFGATGYMGELTARALAAQGARPVLAGRDAQRNGMPARDRPPVADAMQDYFGSPVIFVLSIFGNMAWVVAMVAAAVAFRRSGAGWPVTLLIACSSLFVLHDAGPIGAIGLVCFAAAAVLVERSRTRPTPTVAASPAPET